MQCDTRRNPREVKINQKNIDSLPNLILQRDFHNIRILDIQMNKISVLEGSLFMTLRNLQLLNASKNQIISISSDIQFSEQLEKLILDDNLLRELPSELGSLKELRVLSCHNNMLRFLPNTLVKLSNLAILNVSANKIRHLPLGMVSLSRLEDLQIQNNKIRQLDAFFHMLFDLQVFGCDWFSYTAPALSVLSNQYSRISVDTSSDEERAIRPQDAIESLKNLSLILTHRNPELPMINFVTFLRHFST